MPPAISARPMADPSPTWSSPCTTPTSGVASRPRRPSGGPISCRPERPTSAHHVDDRGGPGGPTTQVLETALQMPAPESLGFTRGTDRDEIYRPRLPSGGLQIVGADLLPVRSVPHVALDLLGDDPVGHRAQQL